MCVYIVYMVYSRVLVLGCNLGTSLGNHRVYIFAYRASGIGKKKVKEIKKKTIGKSLSHLLISASLKKKNPSTEY